MRILYVTPAYKPADRMGGPVPVVAAMAEELVRKGYEVKVVTTNANLDVDIDVPLDSPVEVDGVVVHYFRREEPLRKWLPFVPYLSHSMGFVYAPAMKAALQSLVAWSDVVHTHMPFVYPTYAGAHEAFRQGKPLLYHQHGNFLDLRLARRRLKKNVYLALFEKPIMRRSAMLIALTTAERDAFAAICPGIPCEVIPNGVFLPSSVPGAAERVQTWLGIPPSAQVVLFLGRIHEWKGTPELLEAFERIAGNHPTSWLVVAGPDEVGIAERWRSERRGADRILFPGVVSGRAKDDLLDRADLFCLPSIAEGFSMATLEAMAHRTALLISPGCNFPEAERAGAAIVVEKSVDHLARAMSQLLASLDSMTAMGEAGCRLVEASYSWPAVTDRLTDLYKSITPGCR